MPELSQDTIRELRQSLPLLKRLKGLFTEGASLAGAEFMQLRTALERVRSLTGYEVFSHWVGSIPLPPQGGWYESMNYAVSRQLEALADTLCTYVQGILDTRKTEERLDYLTKENTNLQEQLAELRKRELNYLSIIKGDIPHSVSASYQTERRILENNLHYLREQEAMYGLLETPLHIRNRIEEHERRISEIDAYVANSKTDWI